MSCLGATPSGSRPGRRLGLLLGFAALLGCSRGLTFNVDLKTDFVPGIEFANIEVEISRDGVMVDQSWRRARIDDPFQRPVRVATLSVPAGTYHVRLRLYDPQGALLAERPMVVRLRESYTACITVTRDCRGLRWPREGGDPGLTACLGGRCVPPSCGPDDPEACVVTCTSPSTDCGIVPSCVRVSCEAGACFREAREGACQPGQWCNPDIGCEAIPELPDAGTDVDASAPVCAGPCDDGVFCNGAESCVGGACAPSGNPCSGSEVCNEATDRCDSTSCECTPGQIDDDGGCGNCGTRRRACGDDCRWGGYRCEGEGVCSPRQQDWGAACGACQQELRICNDSCFWNDPSCVIARGAACTDGRRVVEAACSCFGWQAQEECQSCQWVNIGCQNLSGAPMCGTYCDGDIRCMGSRSCHCGAGTWTCGPIGSCIDPP